MKITEEILVKEYLGKYLVCSDGTILRKLNKQIMKVRKQKSGHIELSIIKEGKTLRTGVHRIVAIVFYGDMGDGYEVHHKDFNPSNNNLKNLQWLKKSEHSAIHARDRSKDGKTIKERRLLKSNKTSKYNGVSWHKTYMLWQVIYRHNNKIKFVGNFIDEIEAAKAFDNATKNIEKFNGSRNFI